MTYPELSSKYSETVCTGGVLADGRPVRLYPIPLRYLNEENRFHKYQWIEADIVKSSEDARPESFKINPRTIEVRERILTVPHGWGARADILFRNPDWQYDTVENHLLEAHRQNNISIGVVQPREITNITVVRRPDEDRREFDSKKVELQLQRTVEQQQENLFSAEIIPNLRKLTFVPERIRVGWRCNNPECPGHNMQVFDWEVVELQRREGIDAAIKKVQQVLNLEEYDIRFFLGNFKIHPSSFGIVGIWRPKKTKIGETAQIDWNAI